jgi:hypothetical protein
MVLGLAWLALCAGLYLIGNLPGAAATAVTGSERVKNPRFQDEAAQNHPLLSQPERFPSGGGIPRRDPVPTSRFPAIGPAPALEPVRDKNNLAIFGTGLERPPDFGALEREDGSEAPRE